MPSQQPQPTDQIVFQGRNSPIDYGIAATFGLIGGPLGIPLSLGTIHLLARCAGKSQKWFVWALVGFFVAPLSCMGQAALLPESADQPSQQREVNY